MATRLGADVTIALPAARLLISRATREGSPGVWTHKH